MTEGRNPSVVARFKRRRAKEGSIKCDGCDWNPPKMLDLARMLQAHHCRPLRYGGSDTEENLALLCPNCHAIAHSCDAVFWMPFPIHEWIGPCDLGLMVKILRQARLDPVQFAATVQTWRKPFMDLLATGRATPIIPRPQNLREAEAVT